MPSSSQRYVILNITIILIVRNLFKEVKRMNNKTTPSLTDLLNMDATAIAQKIRKKELTIEQITKTYIEHIQHANPALNAVVEERFDAALAEAREKDKHFPSDIDNYPLYGVPITVKESFDVSDMKTTGGLIHLKDHIATTDAPIVKKLKDAGAIILGKTNTATLCYAQESDNKLYGRTNNPWDLKRTAGGSTGGEGSILAVGGAAAGIGSDIGGSIRLPSHFNGVFGFKSAKYSISNEGHFPGATVPLQQRMESYGPMGKSTRDMQLMYEIIIGEKLTDEDLNDLTINVLPTNIPYPLNDTTKHLLNQVADFLEESFTVQRSMPPYFEESSELWQEIMSLDGSESIERIAFNDEPSTGRLVWTYLREKTRKKTDWHRYLLWALLGSKLFKPSKEKSKSIKQTIVDGDKQLQTDLNDQLLIFPIYHTPTQPHGDVFAEIFSIRKTFKQYMPYLAYASVWGLPALTVPLTFDSENLPIALQIMGLPGQESHIFTLGKVLEKQFTSYVRCDTYDA